MKTSRLFFEFVGVLVFSCFLVMVEGVKMLGSLVGRLRSASNDSDVDLTKGITLFFMSIGAMFLYQHQQKNALLKHKKTAEIKLANQEYNEREQQIMNEIKIMTKHLNDDSEYLLRHHDAVVAYNQEVQRRNAARSSYISVLKSLRKTEEKLIDKEEDNIPVLREKEIALDIGNMLQALSHSYPELHEEDKQDLITIRRTCVELEEHHEQVKNAVSLYLSQTAIFVRLNSEHLSKSDQTTICNIRGKIC